RSQVLVVTGEPGIGKSRLATELGNSLGHGRLFIGRGWPCGAQRRLGPLAEVVEAALGVESTGASTRATIEQAARKVAGNAEARALATDLSVLLLDGSSPRDATRSDRDLLRAARVVLEWAAADAPAVAVFD